MILDERGEFAQARQAAEQAMAGLYTREYLECSRRQIEFTLELLFPSAESVVDLASGMGKFWRSTAWRSGGRCIPGSAISGASTGGGQLWWAH